MIIYGYGNQGDKTRGNEDIKLHLRHITHVRKQ